LVAKELKEGGLVLLYNSRLKLFPGKLKSRWSGPFVIQEVLPYGAVTLMGKSGSAFTINGHRVKPYLADSYDKESTSVLLQDPPSA